MVPAVSMMLYACNTTSPERRSAEQLLASAEAEINNGDPDAGILLLDSIAKTYPEQTEVRKMALSLRPRAVEAKTIREIESTDSLLAELELRYNETESLMKKIDDKNLLEPYYVPVKGYDPKFVSGTGVQARVDAVGQFYMLSSVVGKSLRHIAVGFTSGNESVATKSVKADGETNFRMNGSELITYEPGGCDTIGEFFLKNRNSVVKGFFVGENGKKTPFRLSHDQIDGIADAYVYSRSIVDARNAAVLRQKLERQLQVARDQIARTSLQEKE